MSDPTMPPRLLAEVRQDGSAVLDLAGQQRHLQPGPFDATRTAIAAHAAEAARGMGRAIDVSITGADGSWEITVHGDGNVTDVRQLEQPRGLIDSVPAAAPAPPSPMSQRDAGTPAEPPRADVATEGVEHAGLVGIEHADPEHVEELAATAEHAEPRQPGSSPSLPFPADDLDEDTVLTPPRAEGPPPSPTLPLAAPPASAPATSAPPASAPTASAPASAPPSAPQAAAAPAAPPSAPQAGPPPGPIADGPIASVPRSGASAPVAPQPSFESVLAEPEQDSAAAAPLASAPGHAPEHGAPMQPGHGIHEQHAPASPPVAGIGAPGQQAPSLHAHEAMQMPVSQDGADGARRSFLRTEQREEPAQSGFRGRLNRMGMRVAPGAAELAVRDDERAVSQHWPGPRTIAVVNGKGGAGKTPSTVLLSAVFAQYGGAGVLAWDNNQTRGTLGWRTEQGPHESTLLELLPETERLLGTGAQSADLAHFVHHQAQDKFDVLRSKPMRLAHENRISSDDVDAIHAVAAKFYRLIVIDSGNDESDPMWSRMIDLADQIVVATTTRADHAEAGALLLEALAQRDERSARLARDSVVVVSQADPKASKADVDAVFGGYGPLARSVVRIPFDQSMVDGHLRLSALRPETRRAWLSAAAAVARGL